MDDFGLKLRDLCNSLSGLGPKPDVCFSAAIPILDDESYRSYQEFQRAYGRYLRGPSDHSSELSGIALGGCAGRLVAQEGVWKGKTGRGLQVSLDDGSRVFARNIQHLGYQIEDRESFCPYGYVCDAGKNGFSVSPDGSVFRCPVLNPPADSFLGKLTDGTFRRLKKAAVCYADHCSCSAFSVIKK